MRYLKLLPLITFVGLSAHAAGDLFGSQQWGLHNDGTAQIIDLDPMHTYKIPGRAGEDVDLPTPVQASKKILVAVLDTGIQHDHPDLQGVIHRNPSECAALQKFLDCLKDKDRKECEAKWMDLKNPEVDQDHNGYPLDCQGWSLLGGKNAANIMGRPDFDDDQGHGTHVSGIIAAIANNGIGTRGISNNVEILPVQVLGEQPSEPIKPYSVDIAPTEDQRTPPHSLGDSVARGVMYAIHSGAQVITFSMGWPAGQDSQLMRDTIAEAQRRGIIVVAAAGNDSTRALLRPCTYPGVICVGATGPDGALANFSNYGSGVDIAAPGVNILSTYPESIRPVRFRSTLGYEFLSGTSQATPFVTGAVAELLARGIPASEVMPRLVLGSRPLQASLNLIENMIGNQKISINTDAAPRYLLAGQLDLKKALAVSPQALIVPASKEKIEIQWNRQTSNIDVEVSLINKWQAVDASKVQTQFYFSKPNADSVRPVVLAVNPKQGSSGTWKQGEVRTFVVRLQTAPRMPGELDLIGQVTLPGGAQRRFILDVDVTVPVSPGMKDAEAQTLPIAGLPKGNVDFLPIDQNLDGQPTGRDYIAYTEDDTTRELWLMQQNKNQYQIRGDAKIELDEPVGDPDLFRAQIATRIDWDGDGKSEYVLGYLDESTDDETKTNMQFFIFDQNLHLVKKFKYTSEKALIPYDVYWHMSHGKKFPAWVGGGKDPQKKFGLKDRWENPTLQEANKTRFYYLENETTLRSIEDYNGYKFVDIIEARPDQLQRGAIPVLLAKNEGNDVKSSYLYKFAVAEVLDGQVINFKEMDTFGNSGYRNLFETRVDKVYSTDTDNRIFTGNFWFGEGQLREQRISIFDNKNLDIIDSPLKAQNVETDSALWVRAAFAGSKRNGAFVLTNSEIQYHDLDNHQIASHSMERYTFYPSPLQMNMYFPVTMGDSKNPSERLPALFTTEKSGFNHGVKMLVPVFARDSKVIEVVSPARLRFATNGCIPLATPVFIGGSAGHALDFICKDTVLRIPLTY